MSVFGFNQNMIHMRTSFAKINIKFRKIMTTVHLKFDHWRASHSFYSIICFFHFSNENENNNKNKRKMRKLFNFHPIRILYSLLRRWPQRNSKHSNVHINIAQYWWKLFNGNILNFRKYLKKESDSIYVIHSWDFIMYLTISHT